MNLNVFLNFEFWNSIIYFYKMLSTTQLQILFIFFICILVIMSYGILLCMSGTSRDPLETTPIIWGIDGWSMTHFVFFLFLGYLFPGHFFFVFILGSSWELFEYWFGKNNKKFSRGYDCNLNKLKQDEWWYAKGSDLFLNLLGYIVGSYIATNLSH